MASLVRLTISPRASRAFWGGCDIAGGCVSFNTEMILRPMIATRDRLGARSFPDDVEAAYEDLVARSNKRSADALRRPFGQPYDPEEWATERREEKELTRVVADLNARREYLALVEAIPPVEAAVQRGEDLEVAAQLVLYPGAAWQVEKRCRDAIRLRKFVWAECLGCGRRCSSEECGTLDWSVIADARAGVGGEHLTCPVGHVIYPLQSWVA